MKIKNNYNLQFTEPSSIHLDLIRLISAQLIVISHGLEGYLKIYELHSAGASGLTFLYLISGLLIGHSIFTKMKDKDYDFKEFFLDRFSRIYTSYILVLSIVALIDGYTFIIIGNEIPPSYNIVTFTINLLMLNDSLLGYSFFGSSAQLWTLPIFWWNYMLFGWIILGRRTLKSRIVYYGIIGLFSFILIIVALGYQSPKKITAIIIWLFGMGFSFLLNKLQKKITQKKRETHQKHSFLSKRKALTGICLIISIILFVLALFVLSTHQNAFAIDYSLLLCASFCFFLIVSQLFNFKYPKVIKKPIRFIANYSFTLYLLHVPVFFLYQIFESKMNPRLLFLLVYFFVNINAIFLASFSEMQTSHIKKFFYKHFAK